MGSKHVEVRMCRRQSAGVGVLVALWAAALMAVLPIQGCSSQPSVQVISAERCMASCNRAASDGESCLAWGALTPESCIRRFSAVQSCCGPGDHLECGLITPLAMGLPCVCRDADARGAFVVQGSACQAP